MKPTGILRREAARELGAAAVATLLAAMALGLAGGFGAGYVATAMLLYALGAALVWRGLPERLPGARFGVANRVTLCRLAGSVLLAALLGEPAAHDAAFSWAVVAIAGVTALLDAVDGAVARRRGSASDFGARFDMETDAWLTLVLCALMMHFGKAASWVLVAGLMRYAFVAAARLWPWLSGPLAPSRRRKTVCALQITTLVVGLAPIVSRDAASLLAAAGLVALSASFATDIRTLARGRRQPLEAST